MEIMANNLTFKTLEKTVVNSAILSCEIGQKTAIVGPEGSGKKALLLMLGGYLKPTSGSVEMDRINVFHNLKNYRKKVALGEIENINPLSKEMTPRENISFALEINGKKSTAEDVRKILDIFTIKVYADTPIKECSPLVGAIASIACALANNPEIIILDEPTKKLTSRQARKFWDILEKNLGNRTLIFSSKNFEEAEAHANKIIILENGRVIETI